jgi:hypothetical protein
VRRALAALALPVLVAAGGDYKLDSREWNGLSRLADEATAAGCTLTATETLDWSTLGPRDAVWFVYPRTTVDGGALRRYLEAGGRALVADDFGASDAALAALEIRRLRGELPGVERYDDNPALPIARQSMATELSVGVPAVVANHPAFFSAATPATYAFSPGAALVVEGRLGKGYFVALSDPSVLINNMLDIDDDLAFARALLRRTCKRGERVLLVTQSFVARGEPAGELLAAPTDSPFTRFNRMLESIDDAARTATDGRVLAGLGIVAAALALLLFARAWPPRGRIDGQWTRAVPLVDPHAVDGALAPALLREEVVARLSDSLGAAVTDWTPAELRRRVERVHGAEAGARAEAVWKQMRRLGTGVGARQLVRLHQAALALFDALAAERQGSNG